MEKPNSATRKYTYYLAAIILTIFALIKAKEFLYPIAFSVLIAYMLYPLVNMLEKRHVPRILANLIGIALFLALIGAAILFIYRRIDNLLGEIPALKYQALRNIELIQDMIESEFGFSDLKLRNILQDLASVVFDFGGDSLKKLFHATTGTLVKALLMPVYIFLFLYYRTKFAHFILKIVPHDQKINTLFILRDISSIVTRYMVGVFFVVLTLCFINPIGLMIIGVDYPIILGVISALFSFIPYFGNFIGGSIPFVFTLLTSNDPLDSLKVVILFFIIHFIENNILSPNIVGSNVKINPFFIILGLIAFSAVWGLPGMLVFVPFLAMLKIIFARIPGHEPYAYLLDVRGTRKHAISIENIRKFLKKLRLMKK